MKAAKTQADTNMNFDGMEKMSSKRQPVSGNHWSGHSNDGRLVNKGRGPTVGNDGSCHPVKNAGGTLPRAHTSTHQSAQSKQYLLKAVCVTTSTVAVNTVVKVEQWSGSLVQMPSSVMANQVQYFNRN